MYINDCGIPAVYNECGCNKPPAIPIVDGCVLLLECGQPILQECGSPFKLETA